MKTLYFYNLILPEFFTKLTRLQNEKIFYAFKRVFMYILFP